MITTEINYSSHKQGTRIWRWLLVIVILAAVGYFFLNRSEATTEFEVQIPAQVSVNGAPWLDGDFSRRMTFTIDSSASYNYLEFDHSQLIAGKQSRADGKDIKVISVRGDGSGPNDVEILPTQIEAANTAQALLIFPVSAAPELSYFAYYGNPEAEASGTISSATANRAPVVNATREIPEFTAAKQKNWALKYKRGTEADISLTGTLTELYAVNPINMQIIPAEVQDTHILIKGDLPTGTTKVFFVTTNGEQTFRSNNVSLKHSYPVFVAWSIDWEGNDIADWVMASFDRISEQHSIPLTHFFNPRIYVHPTMSTLRQSELTNYVKARQALYGDEIALHLHMHYDMVEAAGVDPRSTPRWGSGLDGYDVLTSGYNYEEFGKILRWGLKQFADNNLPVPKGYRAGGWFADLEILQAVQDAGFVYDSSGRNKYTFGSRAMPGHWDLNVTTQPYYPSVNNQNISGTNNLKLLEVPNNGNDSYWFTTEDLIGRFNANFPTKTAVVNEPTLVTYLSHPDWFDVDQPRIEALFNEVSRYLYQNDNGPVVYTTLENAIPEWQ